MLVRVCAACPPVTVIDPYSPPDVARLSREIELRPPIAYRYRDVVTAKQTTVRLPEELANEAEAVARVCGMSVNALIIDALAAEIERVRADKDFTTRANRLLKRDKELLDRLAR